MLDRRALDRATLARQLLLRRDGRTTLDAVNHLVGLQAQEPQEPHVGLWSRLAGSAPAELDGLLEQRRVVRTQLMRRTLGRRLPGVDLGASCRPSTTPSSATTTGRGSSPTSTGNSA